MKKLILSVSIAMITSTVFASQGGEGNNTNCNGQGNPNSPCIPSVNPSTPVVNTNTLNVPVTNTNRNNANADASADASASGIGIGIGLGGSSSVSGSGNSRNDISTNQGQAQNQNQTQSISGSGNSTNVLGQSTNAGNLSNVGNASSLSVSGGNTQSNAGNNSSQSTSVNVNTVDPNSLEVARVNAQATKEAARELSDVKVRNTPSAYAAPLTSSNDTCMGSSSGAVAAPGIGVSFGSTWTDSNCKMLKNSRELWNYGMKEAALALMCNDKDVRAALTVTGYKCPAIEQPVQQNLNSGL